MPATLIHRASVQTALQSFRFCLTRSTTNNDEQRSWFPSIFSLRIRELRDGIQQFFRASQRFVWRFNEHLSIWGQLHTQRVWQKPKSYVSPILHFHLYRRDRRKHLRVGGYHVHPEAQNGDKHLHRLPSDQWHVDCVMERTAPAGVLLPERVDAWSRHVQGDKLRTGDQRHGQHPDSHCHLTGKVQLEESNDTSAYTLNEACRLNRCLLSAPKSLHFSKCEHTVSIQPFW